MTAWGYPPGFLGKSAQVIAVTQDRGGMKNERVRNRLKTKAWQRREKTKEAQLWLG
jgi:hypothetical protein